MKKRIQILIVNDSQVLMALISAILETESDFVIAGIARNGLEAVRQTEILFPDLILMDIHMPKMNGVQAVKLIMEKRPKTKILITSATINRNMGLIFDALKYGAIDYLKSPSLNMPPGTRIDKNTLRQVGSRLLKKIHTVLQITKKPPIFAMNKPLKTDLMQTRQIPVALRKNTPMIGIGCSTGGPTTLVVLLNSIPKPLPGPIMVCQHIDPGFDENFAKWLEQETGFITIIPNHLTKIYPNHIYIAPAGKNMLIRNNGFFLEKPSKKQIYIPNITLMLESMAKNCGQKVCGIILTGMGDDGAKGIKTIKENGGYALIQDDQTAIVESMPKCARMQAGINIGYSPEIIGAMAGEWIKKQK